MKNTLRYMLCLSLLGGSGLAYATEGAAPHASKESTKEAMAAMAAMTAARSCIFEKSPGPKIALCTKAIHVIQGASDKNLLPTVFGARGSAYFATRRYDEAIRDYNEAIKLDAKVAYLWYYRGRAYMAKNDSDPAIRNFTKFIKLDPKGAAPAFFLRGSVYNYNKKEYTKAIADYREAGRLNPKLKNLAAKGIAYAKAHLAK